VTDPPPGAGILEEREVPSAGVAGKMYRMVRTAGGWQHVDATCDAWAIKGTCYHVEELNMENGTETTKALAVIEELEDTAIVARISGQITAEWVYRFPVKGQEVVGLSVDGVEAAARECAKLGEAIREIDVRLEYEDEHEARFVARAGRYAVSKDGQEILLDVAIRAKRQPKMMKLRDGGTQFNEFWYEVGVTKAVRNAKEALLPEAVKVKIMAEAENAGRVRQVTAARPKPPLVRQSPPPVRTHAEIMGEPEAARPEEQQQAEPEAIPAAAPQDVKNLPELWKAAKTLGYETKKAVLADLGVSDDTQIGDAQAAWVELQKVAAARKAERLG